MQYETLFVEHLYKAPSPNWKEDDIAEDKQRAEWEVARMLREPVAPHAWHRENTFIR